MAALALVLSGLTLAAIRRPGLRESAVAPDDVGRPDPLGAAPAGGDDSANKPLAPRGVITLPPRGVSTSAMMEGKLASSVVSTAESSCRRGEKDDGGATGSRRKLMLSTEPAKLSAGDAPSCGLNSGDADCQLGVPIAAGESTFHSIVRRAARAPGADDVTAGDVDGPISGEYDLAGVPPTELWPPIDRRSASGVSVPDTNALMHSALTARLRLLPALLGSSDGEVGSSGAVTLVARRCGALLCELHPRGPAEEAEEAGTAKEGDAGEPPEPPEPWSPERMSGKEAMPPPSGLPIQKSDAPEVVPGLALGTHAGEPPPGETSAAS